jgi:hypothetical protein
MAGLCGVMGHCRKPFLARVEVVLRQDSICLKAVDSRTQSSDNPARDGDTLPAIMRKNVNLFSPYSFLFTAMSNIDQPFGQN